MKFTDQQLKAVESPDGEFVVKAGAGTGKTRVLVHKYLSIYKCLTSGGMKPEEACASILTVTFTRRAAKEMLCRMSSIIPEDALRHARISTIDAFCSKYLRENAFRAGLDCDFRVLDGAEAKLLFRKIGSAALEDKQTAAFELESSREAFLNDAFCLVNYLKQRLVSPGEFLQRTEAGNVLDLALHLLYSEYEEHLLRESLMDFGRLLFTAYGILRSDETSRVAMQQQYSHVLVDEYQDTNPGQVRLLRLISEPQKNYFAVGDEQQSIYGFRGADPAHIVDFFNVMPPERKVVLNRSFRTPQPLPGLVNKVFSKIIDGYFPIESEVEGRAEAEVFPARDRAGEAAFVASRVSRFIESGYAPHDIVILMRGVKGAAPFEDALREQGIASVTVGGLGFYQQPEIKDLVAMVLAADNPYSDREVIRVLRSPAFGVRDSVIAAAAKRDKGTPLFSALTRSDNDRVRSAVRFIEHFRAVKNDMPLVGLLSKILEKSGLIYRAAAAPGGTRSRQMSNLNKFLSLARYFESGSVFSSVSDFAAYLRELEEAGIDEPEARPRVPGVVYIMSIHQFKGLEFPVVFVSNVSSLNFPAPAKMDKYHFHEKYGLVVKDDARESTYCGFLKDRLYAEHNQEERRLLYVAMTRSMKHLLVTGSRNSRGALSKYMEYFVEDCENGVVIREGLAGLISLSEPFAEQRAGTAAAQIEQGLTGDKLTRHALNLGVPFYFQRTPVPEFSVTEIETYYRCPLLYKLRYRHKIPDQPRPGVFSPSLFGTAVHRVLEERYREGRPEIRNIKEHLTSLILSSGIDDQCFKNHYIEHVKEVARGIESSDILVSPSDILFVEKPFTLKFGGAYIKGTIDRVDRFPEIRLVDYKTSVGKAVAGYSLQLGIYTLALRDVFGVRTLGSFICHLRSGLMIEVPPMKFAELKLRSLLNGMIHSKFPAAPGKNCRFCNICENTQ